MSTVVEKTRVNETKGDAVDDDLSRLLQLRVPVIVKLAGKRMNVDAITKMTVGTIIEFDTPAEDELELMIGTKPIGFGKAVKIGENFGLRLSNIVDVRETINALGGDSTGQ